MNVLVSYFRGERGRGINKLASLSVYNEDESNDLSDLGIGASSASGKSSLSEDYDTPCAMVSIVEGGCLLWKEFQILFTN